MVVHFDVADAAIFVDEGNVKNMLMLIAHMLALRDGPPADYNPS